MLDNMDFSSLSLEDAHYQLLGVFQTQPDVFSTPENSPCRNHLNLQLWKLFRNNWKPRYCSVKPRENNNNQLCCSLVMCLRSRTNLFQGLIWFEGEPLVQRWQNKYLKTNVLCSDNQYQPHDYTSGYLLVKNKFFNSDNLIAIPKSTLTCLGKKGFR